LTRRFHGLLFGQHAQVSNVAHSGQSCHGDMV
jgi:hypothetical protein